MIALAGMDDSNVPMAVWTAFTAGAKRIVGPSQIPFCMHATATYSTISSWIVSLKRRMGTYSPTPGRSHDDIRSKHSNCFLLHIQRPLEHLLYRPFPKPSIESPNQDDSRCSNRQSGSPSIQQRSARSQSDQAGHKSTRYYAQAPFLLICGQAPQPSQRLTKQPLCSMARPLQVHVRRMNVAEALSNDIHLLRLRTTFQPC
jgi:hypothetical protein